MTTPGTLIFDAYESALTITRTAWSDITCFDGPQAAYPEDGSFFVFGVEDPESDGIHNAVDQGAQTYISEGPAGREETFIIWLTLVEWSGDDNFTALRAQAAAHVKALSMAVRQPPYGNGDGMLNSTLNKVRAGWCGLTVARMRHVNSGEGIAVHVPISIDCYARV